jgi:hypothetical protein
MRWLRFRGEISVLETPLHRNVWQRETPIAAQALQKFQESALKEMPE